MRKFRLCAIAVGTGCAMMAFVGRPPIAGAADIDDFAADAEGSLRAESLTERGYSPYKSGDLQQSLANLNEAIQLCPTCSAPFRAKALVFDALHGSAEAADAADRAIARTPRSGAAFLVRGLNKARAGRFQQAAADYDEAIRLAPALANAYKARANADVKIGRSAQAAADDAMATQLEQGAVLASANAPANSDPQTEKLLSAPALGEDELRHDN